MKLIAALALSFFALAANAQAPETPFAFNPPSASCGGGFTCFMGQYQGSVYMHGMFTINGPATLYFVKSDGTMTTLTGGIVTTTQTLTNPGAYPAIYHVVTNITDATEFENGEAVDSVAMITLDYEWQRVGRSGRGGGWMLTFPGGIKVSGSY
jgi:hypothetical protein